MRISPETILKRFTKRVVDKLPMDLDDEQELLGRIDAAITALELFTGKDVVANAELRRAAADAFALRRSTAAFVEAQRALSGES